MRSAPIVEGQIAVQAPPRLRDTALGLEVAFLIFDRPSEPFDHDMVARRALAVHTHHDLGLLQGRAKGDGGELAALIRVHDLRRVYRARASLNAAPSLA